MERDEGKTNPQYLAVGGGVGSRGIQCTAVDSQVSEHGRPTRTDAFCRLWLRRESVIEA